MATVKITTQIVWSVADSADRSVEICWSALSLQAKRSYVIAWQWLIPAAQTQTVIVWPAANPIGISTAIVWQGLIPGASTSKVLAWQWLTPGPQRCSALVWQWLSPGPEVATVISWQWLSPGPESVTVVSWGIGVPVAIKPEIIWGIGIPVAIKPEIIWSWLINGPGKAIAIIWNGLTGTSIGVAWEVVWWMDTLVVSRREIVWRNQIGTLFMALDAHLKLVSDGTNLAVSSATIGIDRDSWAWSLTGATPDYDAAQAMAPSGSGPVAVELTINSHKFRALVEAVSGTWSFGNRSWSIKGRSPAAILAAPYDAPTTTTWPTDKNARQIVQEVLVGSGFSETWEITDWTIPANGLAVTNATKMDILRQIATATGSIIQADRTAESLLFRYRYPLTPSAWATASVAATLTADFATNLSWTWSPQPGHDYVIVSGRDAGVLVHVKRTGSSFSTPAATIIDPLIGQEIVGRERGRSLLDATGYDKRFYALECPFPLPAAAGAEIIYPGDLVDVDLDDGDSFRGLVDGIKIAFGGGRSTIIITVERPSL